MNYEQWTMNYGQCTMNYGQCTMQYAIRNTPEFTPDFILLAFLSGEIQSTKEYVRNYQRNMQNKPKVKNAQINVSSFITTKYMKVDNWWNRKNKPNSKPNKAKTNPILSAVGGFRKAKMNVNSPIKRDYKKKMISQSEKTNPIKACPELAEALSAAEGAVEWANL